MRPGRARWLWTARACGAPVKGRRLGDRRPHTAWPPRYGRAAHAGCGRHEPAGCSRRGAGSRTVALIRPGRPDTAGPRTPAVDGSMNLSAAREGRRPQEPPARRQGPRHRPGPGPARRRRQDQRDHPLPAAAGHGRRPRRGRGDRRRPATPARARRLPARTPGPLHRHRHRQGHMNKLRRQLKSLPRKDIPLQGQARPGLGHRPRPRGDPSDQGGHREQPAVPQGPGRPSRSRGGAPTARPARPRSPPSTRSPARRPNRPPSPGTPPSSGPATRPAPWPAAAASPPARSGPPGPSTPPPASAATPATRTNPSHASAPDDHKPDASRLHRTPVGVGGEREYPPPGRSPVERVRQYCVINAARITDCLYLRGRAFEKNA